MSEGESKEVNNTLNTISSHISEFITTNDKCYSFLNNPSIIVKRPTNLNFKFVSYREPNIYELYNTKGELLGKLQERSEGISGFLKRNVLSSIRSFTMDLIDNEGHVILIIHRGFTTALQRSELKIFIPNDKGEETLIGESIHHLDILKKKYTLKAISNKEENNKLVEFGEIETELFQWKFPVYGKNKGIIAEVDRDFHDLKLELLSDSNVYIVKMDSSAFKDGKSEYGPLRKHGMSLVERAVVFASVVAIDLNYFSDECMGE